MKVLVTGADGFIGSHLIEHLLERGYHVRALAQYNSFNSWGWLEDLENLDQVEVLTGDIRDSHFCFQMTKNMDYVFHLAALIAIPYSYIAPQSYIDTNVTGTLNICQAALKNGVKRLVQTSTSEVYGTAQYVPIDENHPLQAQSPYSASKIGADAIATSFYNAFDLPVITARPFNTFGPRQSARAVIPTIITQIANGMKEIKLGDLRPTRDFNFVKDTCYALEKLAQSEAAIGKTVNISANKEISIGDCFELIREIMNADVICCEDKQRLRPQNSEVFRLWGDNTLLQQLTGYRSQVGLREGMQQTVQWFSKAENLAKYKANIYNV